MTWLADWLSNTYLHEVISDTTRTATWLIIPVSQSIHILAVAMVMMSVALINLRLLGVAGTRQSTSRVIEQLMPWIWPPLIILLVTGAVQTIGEPTRELESTTFWVKMSLLAAAVGLTVISRNTVRKDPHYWEHSPNRRTAVRVLATLSLVLWVGIVAAGRLIAYV